MADLPTESAFTTPPVGGYAFGAYNNALASTGQQIKNALGQLQTQYYPQVTQAEINYQNALTSAIPSEIQQRQAQSGLLGSETGINQWKLAAKYPLLSDTLQVLAAANNGNVPGNNNAINVPGSNIQGSPNVINYLNSPEAQQQLRETGQVTIPQNINSVSQLPNGNSSNSLLMQRLNPLGYAQQMANIPLNNELIKDSSDSALTANKGYLALTEMDNAYKDLGPLQKGPLVGGYLHAVSPSAQKFEQGAASLKALMAQAFQSGHITDKDLTLSNEMGASRLQTPEAYKQYSDFNKLLFQRMEEKPEFFAAAQHMGIPPQISQPLYSKYMKERPVYDFDNKKPIDGNLNSFSDYLNPQAINAMLKGQPYEPRTFANVTVETPDGKEWNIRGDKVQEALKRYPGSKVIDNG
jgi:hypothetical protein